jgi:hypothetical protein
MQDASDRGTLQKESVLLMSTVIGVYREALLRLADEVDQLRAEDAD